eukprot:Rmarinus@m.6087
MSTNRTILLAVNSSQGSLYASNWVAKELYRENDRVVVVCATEPSNLATPINTGCGAVELTSATLAKNMEHIADKNLQNFSKRLHNHKIPHETLKVEGYEGISEAICHAAADQNAGVIVLGCAQKGAVGRALLGSVSDGVLHHSPCSVVICRHPDQWKAEDPLGENLPRNVVICVDTDDSSIFAFNWAKNNILRASDKVDVVTVTDESSKFEKEELLDSFARDPDFQINIVRLNMQASKLNYRPSSSKVGHHIEDYVEKMQADVVIMGCRELGAMKRFFLGSVSDHVVHHVHCPIIICHDKHRKS